MAARALLQRRAAPLTAALLAGGIVLRPSVAHAEAPNSVHSKKPIYDDYVDIGALALPPAKSNTTTNATATAGAEQTTAPASSSEAVSQSPALSPSSSSSIPTAAATAATEVVTRSPRGPTPTERLAAEIRQARLFLYRQACAAEDGVNAALGRAFALERSFTSTMAGLAPPRESGERLMPGLVYVLVAAMAGSIVTRRSNVVVRAAGPVALGLGAAWVVIPITMGNVADLAWSYEKRFPAVANAHVRTREGVERGWYMARVHTEAAGRIITERVSETREAVEGWVRKGK